MVIKNHLFINLINIKEFIFLISIEYRFNDFSFVANLFISLNFQFVANNYINSLNFLLFDLSTILKFIFSFNIFIIIMNIINLFLLINFIFMDLI